MIYFQSQDKLNILPLICSYSGKRSEPSNVKYMAQEQPNTGDSQRGSLQHTCKTRLRARSGMPRPYKKSPCWTLTSSSLSGNHSQDQQHPC